jgi:CheY-like chemotaxis protein
MSTQEQKTILLVEDEILIEVVEKEMIKSFGYKVITANSGEEAINIAIGNERINLVLMDINLGRGIDGLEAAKQILKKKNMPIVFLTSHSEKEYVDKLKEITCYGCVFKASGDFVLRASIEIALDLFEVNKNLQLKMDLMRESQEKYWNVFVPDSDALFLVDKGKGKVVIETKGASRIKSEDSPI